MNVLLSLVFSLILTGVVSFFFSIVACVSILGFLYLIVQMNVMGLWPEFAYEGVWRFFVVFGEGSPWAGIFIIALTVGIVGLMFELFNFYHYQTLIAQNMTFPWQMSKLFNVSSRIGCDSK